jgi:hypothetical protein
MSGRPAAVRARDLKQAIIAARNAGAPKVEVKLPGEAAVIIHLDRPGQARRLSSGRWVSSAVFRPIGRRSAAPASRFLPATASKPLIQIFGS